jgi:hypothetical protein
MGIPDVGTKRITGYEEDRLSNEGKRDGRENLGGETGIIVFGGGSRCSGRGCLFWLLVSAVLSVILPVLANLLLYLLSGPSVGI